MKISDGTSILISHRVVNVNDLPRYYPRLRQQQKEQIFFIGPKQFIQLSDFILTHPPTRIF